MGKSRSVSAVISYVMFLFETLSTQTLSCQTSPQSQSRRATFDDALALVQKHHPIARPNPGYKQQLQGLQFLTHFPIEVLAILALYLDGSPGPKEPKSFNDSSKRTKPWIPSAVARARAAAQVPATNL